MIEVKEFDDLMDISFQMETDDPFEDFIFLKHFINTENDNDIQ